MELALIQRSGHQVAQLVQRDIIRHQPDQLCVAIVQLEHTWQQLVLRHRQAARIAQLALILHPLLQDLQVVLHALLGHIVPPLV